MNYHRGNIHFFIFDFPVGNDYRGHIVLHETLPQKICTYAADSWITKDGREQNKRKVQCCNNFVRRAVHPLMITVMHSGDFEQQMHYFNEKCGNECGKAGQSK